MNGRLWLPRAFPLNMAPLLVEIVAVALREPLGSSAQDGLPLRSYRISDRTFALVA